MVINPFVPQQLIGRDLELQRICDILATDGDLLIAGVSGSGRHTLIHWAAQKVGARVLQIDCMRASQRKRFLQLLAESLMLTFTAASEIAILQRQLAGQPLVLEQVTGQRAKLVWHCTPAEEWGLFQFMLSLPQVIAETLDCRVVIVFENFPHMRAWDRSGEWEAYLRQEIQRQSRVSYALITTVAEPWVQDSSLQVISLAPLENQPLQAWIEAAMAEQGLVFDPESQAVHLFLDYVQGNLGEAIALAQRIWLDCCLQKLELLRSHPIDQPQRIPAHQVYRSALALAEDLSLTFEALILLLPASQVQVLESLALDPTDSPHSRDYIRRHQLSKGGSLQGALSSLEQKGLVYGPRYGYRIAMPMLAFWLRQRLS